MKKLNRIELIAMSLIAINSISFAGGDLLPVVEQVEEDILNASLIPVEEVKKAVVLPTPIVVKPVKIKEPTKEAKKLGWYIGGGLTMGRVKDAHCEDITYGVMAKAGYDLNKYVGIEGRAIRTNWEYEGAKIKHLGLFLKPQYPITEDINLYGLLGYAKTATSSKKVLSEKGFAYGAGLDYDLGDKNDWSLFADYERLIQKSNISDIDALSLGLAYRF